MRKTVITGIILVIVLVACKNKETGKQDYVERNTFLEIEDDLYQLVRPKENPKEVLILFGGYPENAEDQIESPPYRDLTEFDLFK